MYNRIDLLKKLGWSVGGSVVQLVVGLTSIIVLTRILTPVDYGVFGIALLAIVAGEVLTGGVLASKIEQAAELNLTQAHSVFWANTAIAALYAAIIIILAPKLAVWLGAKEAAAVICAATGMLFVDALGAVPRALMKRRQQFRPLAKIGMVSAVAGLILAVILAAQGFGAWALIGMEVLRRLLHTGLCFVFAKWRPAASFNFQALCEAWSFGAAMLLGAVLGRIDNTAPKIAAVVLLGPEALGILQVAYRIGDQVQAFLAGPLGAMALPVFSKVAGQRAVLHQMMEDGWRAIAIISFPVCAGLASLLPSLVPFAVGDAFAIAGPLSALIVLASLRISASKVNIGASQAVGRADLANASMVFGFIAHVIALILLAPFGLLGIGAATLLRAYLTWPIAGWFTERATGFTVSHQIAILLPPLLASLVMVGTVLAVGNHYQPSLPQFGTLGLQILTGVMIYVPALLLIDSQARQLLATRFAQRADSTR